MKLNASHAAGPLSVLLGLMTAAGCGSGSMDRDESLLDSDVGVSEEGIQKGLPGAVLGMGNYCDNPANPCTLGEGDCDSNAGCVAGLVCGRNKGRQYPGSAGSACVPPTCVNKRLDAGETQIDCGGTCGSICFAPVCSPIGTNRCNADCLCGIGEGDCDSNADCVAPLICGGRLERFGFPAGDACVPAHCKNKVLDGNETQIDCGGSCGTLGSCATGPAPLCGNGVVNGPALTSIVYTWLSTGCFGPFPVVFTINGSLALNTDSDPGMCTCTPGISTATVTDAPTLALVIGGTNQFGVDANNPSLAFAWAKVTLNFADNTSTTLVLDDVNQTGDAEANEANLCNAGNEGGRAPATQTLNGVPGEECDDGNVMGGDGCNADCTL